MLKLADFKDMTDEEVIEHIVYSYADDRDDGYGRSGQVVTEKTIREKLEKYEVLVVYEYVGSWGCDSSSFFILKNKETGMFAYNSGSHCSCYGFEGQFDPEDMPVEWFMRDDFAKYGYGGYDDDDKEHKHQVKEWVRTNIGGEFDPSEKEMWETVLSCLADDEDGSGYLFDHFKTKEDKIKAWMEKQQ